MSQIQEYEKQISVVNANRGVNNHIGKKQVELIMDGILNSMIDILSKHCGPSSRYALVLSPGTMGMREIFTKDGANIINSVEHLSPIEQYLKNIIKFIGDCVDNVSKDGTTTSMIFACSFLSYLLRRFPNKMQNTGTKFLTDQYKDFEDYVNMKLNNYLFTVETLMEEYNLTEQQSRYLIAWMQAMTSSGGDKELSNKLALFFMNYSKEIDARSLKFHTFEYETDEKYVIINDDSDFNLEAIINKSDDLNIELGTEMLYDDIDIIASYDGLEDSLFSTLAILDYCKESTKPILIFAYFCGPLFEMEVDKLNKEHGKNIIVVKYNPTIEVIRRINIEALLSVAMVEKDLVINVDNKPAFNLNAIIKNAKVHYKNKIMYFYNLYEKNDEIISSNIHPAAKDQNLFKPYMQLIMTIRQKLHELEFAHFKQPGLLKEYTMILEKMINVANQRIYLGGSKHEVQAGMDVMTDAIGAVNASLKYGFSFGGFIPLMKIINDLKQEIQNKIHEDIRFRGELAESVEGYVLKETLSWNLFLNELENLPFIKACMYATTLTQRNISPCFDFTRYPDEESIKTDSMISMYETIKGTQLTVIPATQIDLLLNKKDAFIYIDHFNLPTLCDLTTFVERFKKNNFTCEGIEIENVNLDRDYVNFSGGNIYPIIQPFNMYKELFKRIGDIVIKLICTDKILVNNTVFLEEQSEEQKDS